MKTFEARTLEQWRAWLAKNHASASEVWLDRTPQRRPRTAAVRIVFGLGYC